MLVILNSLYIHNFPIFHLILMILASKSMLHRALSDETYLLLGFLSPLRQRLNGTLSNEQMVISSSWICEKYLINNSSLTVC